MAAAAVERDGRCLVIDLHSFPDLPRWHAQTSDSPAPEVLPPASIRKYFKPVLDFGNGHC